MEGLELKKTHNEGMSHEEKSKANQNKRGPSPTMPRGLARRNMHGHRKAVGRSRPGQQVPGAVDDLFGRHFLSTIYAGQAGGEGGFTRCVGKE